MYYILIDLKNEVVIGLKGEEKFKKELERLKGDGEENYFYIADLDKNVYEEMVMIFYEKYKEFSMLVEDVKLSEKVKEVDLEEVRDKMKGIVRKVNQLKGKRYLLPKHLLDVDVLEDESEVLYCKVEDVDLLEEVVELTWNDPEDGEVMVDYVSISDFVKYARNLSEKAVIK